MPLGKAIPNAISFISKTVKATAKSSKFGLTNISHGTGDIMASGIAGIGAALTLRGIAGGVGGGYKWARNSGLINPLLYGRRVHHGFGKRGIDSNNQSTDGLVQSLHRNRRQQR